MKFAHLADCHLGGWRDPVLRSLGLEAFSRSCDICIKEQVAFIVIAGDIFDTALPSFDVLRSVTAVLQRVKEAGVSVYIIPGSHDYSPSGKTMISVLEEAKLLVNVMKLVDGSFVFTEDSSGVKLVGYKGRKLGLEQDELVQCDFLSLVREQGKKIFLFHTTIQEMLSSGLDMLTGVSHSVFPSGFNYYAGGHIHQRIVYHAEGYGPFVYPGPLFPNNFAELETCRHGGFYFVSLDDFSMEFVPLELAPVVSYTFDVTGKTVDALYSEVLTTVGDVAGTIVLLRFCGMMTEGQILSVATLREYLTGACILLVSLPNIELPIADVVVVAAGAPHIIEDTLLRESLELPDALHRAQELLRLLSCEKEGGETVGDFHQRVLAMGLPLFE